MCVFCDSPIAILEALITTYRACDSAPFMFDLLVDACLESKKIDSAMEIYAILKSKKVFLNTRTCNVLLELVLRSRGCFHGYDMYREMFHCGDDIVCKNGKCNKAVLPNANTMNVVMAGFYREGLVDKVDEVWEEMLGIGCVPNRYIFNVLRATYCDAGRIEDAMRVWDEVENKVLKHDAVSFNTVIGSVCQVGEVARAEEIYWHMAMKGVENTCITYENLINGYCKIEDLDSAMLAYKDMCRKSFSPESTSVNAIVGSLFLKKEISGALEFWRTTGKKHDVVLAKENYKNLTKGLCEAEKMEDALKIQVEMVTKGFEPNLEIYHAFIDGYLKHGNETIAGILREEMLRKKVS